MKAVPLDTVICELVKKQRISNQKNFLVLLEAEGFQLNQSTLSRHLSKLNIHKKEGFYQFIPMPLEAAGGPVANLVTEVKLAPPNLVFIQALPGHAAAVGYYLDKLAIEHIVGTVAGDDTLLVAVAPPESLEQVLEALRNGLGLNQPQ